MTRGDLIRLLSDQTRFENFCKRSGINIPDLLPVGFNEYLADVKKHASGKLLSMSSNLGIDSQDVEISTLVAIYAEVLDNFSKSPVSIILAHITLLRVFFDRIMSNYEKDIEPIELFEINMLIKDLSDSFGVSQCKNMAKSLSADILSELSKRFEINKHTYDLKELIEIVKAVDIISNKIHVLSDTESDND